MRAALCWSTAKARAWMSKSVPGIAGGPTVVGKGENLAGDADENSLRRIRQRRRLNLMQSRHRRARTPLTRTPSFCRMGYPNFEDLKNSPARSRSEAVLIGTPQPRSTMLMRSNLASSMRFAVIVAAYCAASADVWAEVSFSAGPQIPFSAASTAATVADFNGDSNSDFFYSTSPSTSATTLLLGDGAGGFTAVTNTLNGGDVAIAAQLNPGTTPDLVQLGGSQPANCCEHWELPVLCFHQRSCCCQHPNRPRCRGVRRTARSGRLCVEPHRFWRATLLGQQRRNVRYAHHCLHDQRGTYRSTRCGAL
jgi:hypothetical protein